MNTLLDNDGYPTDAALDALADYTGTPKGLYELIRSMWALVELADPIVTTDDRGVDEWAIKLVTGGWSGNETIVAEMRHNSSFWFLFWESSSRGGLHEFRVPIHLWENSQMWWLAKLRVEEDQS